MLLPDGVGHAELERPTNVHALEQLFRQRRRHHQRLPEAVGEGHQRVVGHQVVHLVHQQERVVAEVDLRQHRLRALERAEDGQLASSMHSSAHLL